MGLNAFPPDIYASLFTIKAVYVGRGQNITIALPLNGTVGIIFFCGRIKQQPMRYEFGFNRFNSFV